GAGAAAGRARRRGRRGALGARDSRRGGQTAPPCRRARPPPDRGARPPRRGARAAPRRRSSALPGAGHRLRRGPARTRAAPRLRVGNARTGPGEAGSFRAVLFALSAGQKTGLGLMAAAFIAFALASSFWIPRFRPDFPGRAVKAFVALCIVLTIGMLATVIAVAKEKEEPGAHEAATETTAPQPTPPSPSPPPTSPPPAGAGDPAKGKA